MEVTRPTPIVHVDEPPTSSQPEQVTSMIVHHSYLNSRKAKPKKFQYLLEALNAVAKEFSDIENENDDCHSDE